MAALAAYLGVMPAEVGCLMLSWLRRSPQRPDAEDPWLIASTEEEGLRVLYRMRQKLPDGIDTTRYPHLMNIYWHFDGTTNEGMPPTAVYDRMAELEEMLEPLEGAATGFLVLSITGNNRKEWAWYVADPHAYMAQANAALVGVDPFPVEFEAAMDADWRNFKDLLVAVGKRES
jgi:hypothetical protein